MIELLGVLAIAAMLMLATMPPLMEALHNSRLRSAARQVAGEIRYARSRAVGTGWQYRLTGFSAGASDDHRNQYRIMARDSAGVAWPALSVDASETPTLVVGEWVDLSALYPGVTINPADSGEFALAFDTRGTPIEISLNFDPLWLTRDSGGAASLVVSTTGSVRVY